MKTRNRELWVKRVERWCDSGLSAKEFAAEIGVKAGTLAHWKWRFGAERRGKRGLCRKKALHPTVPAFIEVTPVAMAHALAKSPSAQAETELPPTKQREVPLVHEPFEVMLRNGLRIRVPIYFEAVSLERLVAVLQER
jgi:hypothetical protein